MAPNRFVFNRSALAQAFTRDLAGEGIADYSSGMFLAAPRRTGKSTFLKIDLIPASESQGWLPVYVDLWARKEVDPGDLIAGAIAEALIPFEGRLRKMAKSIGLDKLNVLRTLSWDFSKPQLPEQATLAHALELLHQASGQMIVLIIDEAQHALNTENGLNTMFGLKAARDQLNQGRESDGLRLVFTGSSRDKLANLVLKRDQPFFGASITPFPLLGRDFVNGYTAFVNNRLAEQNQFAAEDMAYAFTLVGNRPEMLATIVKDVSVDFGAASNLGELLRSGALAHQAGIWGEFESAWNNLTAPQQSVLQVMAERAIKKEPFSPFADATLKAVTQALERKGSDVQPTTTTLQNAIIALRDKELIWKSNRGEYALEDSAMAEWLVHQRQ